MDNEEYTELVNDINDTILCNYKMKICIFLDMLFIYINQESKEDKEISISILNKQLSLANRENEVLEYLKQNLYNINDYDKIGTFLDEIDYIFECNYKLFDDDYIKNIDSNSFKKYDRIVRQISDSLLSYNDVVIFLKENGYKNGKYFKYIKKRIRYTHDKRFYGCYPIYKDDLLVDFLMYIPKIIDLHTYLINLHEHCHAYELYNKLNTKSDIDIDKSEETVKIFEKKYLKKRFDLSTN